ncbi:hypothetical protein G9A89_001652 [Geosiphon pyriformis]|nr:hypothetical protein G9A89_001652 [Geosiphon pyriformis]
MNATILFPFINFDLVHIGELDPFFAARNPETWLYELEVVQQPFRARMCGFGDKDRRTISPAPIVKLVVKNHQGELITPSKLNYSFFVVHVALWKADVFEQPMVVGHPHPVSTPVDPDQLITNNLIGTKVASPYLLYDLLGLQGIFFIFSDLSIRTDGIFKLFFSLIDIDNRRKVINNGDKSSDVLTIAYSQNFEVYPAKIFPGMIETTALTRWFAGQGIKIPVRNSSLSRRNVSHKQSRKI